MDDDVLRQYGRNELDEYSHWVYVLSCHSKARDFEGLERRSRKRLDREPGWLRQAWEASKVYYVGQTEDIEKRLGQHYQQHHAADFTELFQPTHVIQLNPLYSRSQAEYQESKIADAYDGDGRFAYYA
jgi:predicted GIY-YIG superfamily endonuclease